MVSKNSRSLTVLIVGIVISIIGVLLIGTFITEAYISRIGEPDQSLLFWYLPFLFVGFLALVTGLITGIRGFTGLRKIRIDRPLSLIFAIVLIIIVTVPLSIIATILLVPFWSWLEASTGIESLGHSGPAEWCYAVIFLLLTAAAATVKMRMQLRKKNEEST